MAATPTFAVFSNAERIRIKHWFRSVDPEALSIYFVNDRAFRFYASDGYYWDIQEDNGLVYIYGVSLAVFQDVAARAGHVSYQPPRDPSQGEVERLDAEGIKWDDWDLNDGHAELEQILVEAEEWDDWDDGNNVSRKEKGYDIVKLLSTRRKFPTEVKTTI